MDDDRFIGEVLMEYVALKWLHVVSSTLLFGTGIGSAFYKWLADRDGNLEHMARTNRHVVLADWLFTAPTVVLQPLTGIAMVIMTGYSFTTFWVMGSIVLYVLAGLCWLPVVVIQIRMRDLCNESLVNGTALPERYFIYSRWWFWLGVVAFISLVVVFFLMVFKPLNYFILPA